MKRRIILSLLILMVLFLCGCSNGFSSHTASNNSVKDVLENEVSKEENTESEEAR
jgi:PBP1b-binding outer membrane lipoprotein LpoB